MKICIFDYEKKLIEDIYEAKKTEVGLRFNDGKCDSNGRFWISGIGNEEEKINSSIFIFSKKNSCHIKKRNQILLGNGLGWNKHKSSFYFTDSKKQQILLFSYYKDPIQMESQNSVFFESKQKGHEPDGLYVDKNGYVWSCIWDAGEILRINPDGKVELKIKLPISRPTSLTFGGAMLDIMLVTTAMSNENSSKLNHLHEGKCFMYKSMPYGLPTQNFKL